MYDMLVLISICLYSRITTKWGDHDHLQPEDVELSPYVFQDIHFAEALRVLLVELKITSIDDPATPGLVDPNRPTIYFNGTSHGGSPNESRVHGHVSVTSSGDIRWHLVRRSVHSFSLENAIR